MSGVCLISQPLSSESGDAIEYSNFLATTFSETSFDFESEGLLQLLLVPVQLEITTDGGEVIAVHCHRNTFARVTEAAWGAMPLLNPVLVRACV